MHWYQSALIFGSIVAAMLAWNVPRAVTWIGLGLVSGIASAIWHDSGLPHGAAFGAALNLIICVLLYTYAELRYEMRVWNAFHLMIIIDILYLTGLIETHYAFAVSLELANWLAIMIIATTGMLERVRSHGWNPDSSNHSWAGRLYRALYAKRTLPVFWERP